MKSEDIEVLQFLHDRLIHVHDENKNVDYLHDLRRIIEEYLYSSEDTIRCSFDYVYYIMSCMSFKDRVLICMGVLLGKKYILRYIKKSNNKDEKEE